MQIRTKLALVSLLLFSPVLCSAQDGTLVVTHQTELPPLVTQVPPLVITDCQARMTIDYSQRGAIARVTGEIDHDMCPASHGSFVVSVRTTGDDGSMLTQEFPETWSRTDAQPVSFSADYEIGDNVDLGRVRALKLRCKCGSPETPAP